MTFLLRDFVETAEGLIFALVANGLESGRAIGFLRYVRDGGRLHKADTEAANAHLRRHHPYYLFYSEPRDATVHGVPVGKIIRHFRPRRRLAEIMSAHGGDAVEADVRSLCSLLRGAGLNLAQVGVTGSVLIGAQGPASDIDLVIYGRENFHRARGIIEKLQAQDDVGALDEELWRETYRRRGCALGFDEYLRHEKRKFNKGAINGRKFDIGPAEPQTGGDGRRFRKESGPTILRARVAEDLRSFDYPAVYGLDHPQIGEALSFTPTYAGQAQAGEWVEISGFVEVCEAGNRRIVVGSSREAPQEYIRVVDGL